jgi:hypothetical protein
MSWDAYTKCPAMNASTMKQAFKSRDDVSMLAFKWAYENKSDKDTEAMQFGRALHTLLLEPGEFHNRFAAYEGVRNRRFYEYQKFLADHEGCEVMKATGAYSYEEALKAGVSLATCKAVKPLINTGFAESTAMFGVEGVQMRGRIDWVATREQVIMDVKSARSVAPRPFGNQFFSLFYDMQLGLYQEAVRQTTGHDWPVVVAAIENSPPYEVVVYEIPQAVLDQGLDRAKDLLRRLVTCVAMDCWPGIQPLNEDTVPLFVPNWEMQDEVVWDE